jgi:hypothetical protein
MSSNVIVIIFAVITIGLAVLAVIVDRREAPARQSYRTALAVASDTPPPPPASWTPFIAGATLLGLGVTLLSNNVVWPWTPARPVTIGSCSGEAWAPAAVHTNEKAIVQLTLPLRCRDEMKGTQLWVDGSSPAPAPFFGVVPPKNPAQASTAQTTETASWFVAVNPGTQHLTLVVPAPSAALSMPPSASLDVPLEVTGKTPLTLDDVAKNGTDFFGSLITIAGLIASAFGLLRKS